MFTVPVGNLLQIGWEMTEIFDASDWGVWPMFGEPI